jgi:cytochrome c556
MKRILSATTVLALSLGGAAWAQDDSPYAMPIAARQGLMTYMAINLGTLGGMAKGSVPFDATAAKTAADNIAAAANMDMSMLWPQGSDDATNMQTKALAGIWAEGSTIGAKMDALKTSAAAMQTAAATDLPALQEAMKGLGGACAACHKEYRASE